MLLKFRKESKYNSNEKPLAVTETKNSVVTLLCKLSSQGCALMTPHGSSDDLHLHLKAL